MNSRDYLLEYSNEVKSLKETKTKPSGLGIGKGISKIYSKHKKPIIISTIISTLAIAAFNLATDGMVHYKLGMERAGESHIVNNALNNLEIANNRIISLEDRVVESEVETMQLQERISQAQDNDSRRYNDLTTLRQNYSTALVRIDSLEEQLNTLRTQNSSYNSTSIQNNNQIALLTSQISEYETQIRNNNNTISQLRTRIEQLTNPNNIVPTSIQSNITNNVNHLIRILGNQNRDNELRIKLDNYDAILFYSNSNIELTLDIIDKNCNNNCLSHARITSNESTSYKLEWGSFNNSNGGIILTDHAYRQALIMLR